MAARFSLRDPRATRLALQTIRPNLPKFSVQLAASFSLMAGFLLCASSASAQMSETPPLRPHWSAQWISHPTAPLREPITLHFKKAFDVKAVPAHFVVHAS